MYTSHCQRVNICDIFNLHNDLHKMIVIICGGIRVAPRKVQKRPSSGQRKSNSQRTGKKSVSKASRKLRTEIQGVIIVALGIIMALSVYSDDLAGDIGNILGQIVGGLFGLTGYVIPILIIIHGICKIFKPKLLNQDRRFFLLLALIILISAMLQSGLFDPTKYEKMNFVGYINEFYSEGKSAIGKGEAFLASGGILGGIIGIPLLFVLKKWGTMIVLITLSLIVAMLITRLSLADAARSVAKGTTDAINGVVGAARKKREERIIQRTIQEQEYENNSSDNKSRKNSKNHIVDFPLKDGYDTIPLNQSEIDINNQPSDGIIMGDEPVLHDDKLNILNPLGTTKEHSSPSKTSKTLSESNDVEKTAKVEKAPVEDEAINYSNGRTRYVFPPIELLSKSKEGESNMRRIRSASVNNAKKLESTFESFGIGVKVLNVSVGPAFTRYELQPAPGVKVSKIVNLTDDIALNLAATGVRIEAPIPGKAAIGIEVPNKEVAPISLRSVIESPVFRNHKSSLAVALGKDITGEDAVIDLAKMPHILIAGATGSGKSVCINSFITSLIYKSSPDNVKLLMIDPKVVELGVYNGIPHLLIPVVTDPNKAAGALRWAVSEMTMRYKLFAEKGVRDLLGYNAYIEEAGEGAKLPQVVIIIDELADLMMVAPHDVEDSICRLAQMARAAGMHLVIATQRPSVNVITGVIKANIPSRIAFAVSSQVDSRTIIDMAGAEKLLGKGDMLYYPVGIPKPVRVKGAFVTDKEVELVVDFVKNQIRASYDQDIIENINDNVKSSEESAVEDDHDELLNQAIEAVIDCGQASVSFVQRKFKVGYARAGRIIDQMSERNIISGYEGSKPRRILISRERWEEMKMSNPGVER